jgi:hypothetical protein
MDYFLILWIASSVVALLPRNDGGRIYNDERHGLLRHYMPCDDGIIILPA